MYIVVDFDNIDRRTSRDGLIPLRKLGPGAETFIRNVVPKLLKSRVLSQDWNTRDHPYRYHLAMSMERVHVALRHASGSIDEFLKEVNPSGS